MRTLLHSLLMALLIPVFLQAMEMAIQAPLTPLMLACKAGDVEQIKLLLDAGADARVKDLHNRDAFCQTLENYLQEANTCRLLPTIQNPSYLKILPTELLGEVQSYRQRMLRDQCLSILTCLLNHPPTQGYKKELLDQLIGNTGPTPLTLACAANNYELVQFLVSAGASIDKIDGNGVNALTLAINQDNLANVDYFLAHGARLTIKPGTENMLSNNSQAIDLYKRLAYRLLSKHTALSNAIVRNSRPIINLLLSHGIKLSQEDLKTAIGTKKVDLVKFLLEHPHTTSNKALLLNPRNGINPLCYAAEHGNLAIVQLLVSLGANIKATNESGITAAEIASRTGKHDIAYFLEELSSPAWEQEAREFQSSLALTLSPIILLALLPSKDQI